MDEDDGEENKKLDMNGRNFADSDGGSLCSDWQQEGAWKRIETRNCKIITLQKILLFII